MAESGAELRLDSPRRVPRSPYSRATRGRIAPCWTNCGLIAFRRWRSSSTSRTASNSSPQSMAARKAGKIINIGSEYSRFGNQIAPSYAASKGGLIQLTKSMAIELAPHNVQVNAIVPGWIESDMTAPIKSRPFYNEILMRTPAGRLGTPEECAGTAIFLASHASDFVTGATIFVDGGYAIR